MRFCIPRNLIDSRSVSLSSADTDSKKNYGWRFAEMCMGVTAKILSLMGNE